MADVTSESCTLVKWARRWLRCCGGGAGWCCGRRPDAALRRPVAPNLADLRDVRSVSELSRTLTPGVAVSNALSARCRMGDGSRAAHGC